MKKLCRVSEQGINVNNFQLSIVHRLPRPYRWASGRAGVQVEPLSEPESQKADDRLIGIKLLSQRGEAAWQVMRDLDLSLQEVQVASTIVALEGEPCLFVHADDESTVMCRLKNAGVVIAEPVVQPVFL